MKSLLPAFLIATCCLMNGQDAETDRASLLREFTPAASRILEQPFIGSIRVVWPKTKIEAKPEFVSLNFMRPADVHRGHSPIDTPYLATTEKGNSYWGAFALRSDLPDTDKLASFSNYKEIVDLLGAPTHLPFSGETDARWAYDTVSWRLYSPSEVDSIEILEVTVARKSLLDDARDNRYLIESYLVRRGTLTESEKEGGAQTSTAPRSKPERDTKLQPEQKGRPK